MVETIYAKLSLETFPKFSVWGVSGTEETQKVGWSKGLVPTLDGPLLSHSQPQEMVPHGQVQAVPCVFPRFEVRQIVHRVWLGRFGE